MGEVWVRLESNPDYAVSAGGEVMRLTAQGRRTYVGKLLKGRAHSHGYLRVALRKQDAFIHRLVATHHVHNPDPLTLTQVNHLDGDKTHNSASNLEWCDHKGNMQHAASMGLTTLGERNSQTKLTPEQVKEIRTLYTTGNVTQRVLAKQFCVDRKNISSIVNKQTWRHVM